MHLLFNWKRGDAELADWREKMSEIKEKEKKRKEKKQKEKLAKSTNKA